MGVTHKHTCMHARTHAHTCVCTHTYVHAHTHARACTHTCTCMHAHTHTHTDTHAVAGTLSIFSLTPFCQEWTDSDSAFLFTLQNSPRLKLDFPRNHSNPFSFPLLLPSVPFVVSLICSFSPKHSLPKPYAQQICPRLRLQGTRPKTSGLISLCQVLFLE